MSLSCPMKTGSVKRPLWPPRASQAWHSLPSLRQNRPVNPYGLDVRLAQCPSAPLVVSFVLPFVSLSLPSKQPVLQMASVPWTSSQLVVTSWILATFLAQFLAQYLATFLALSLAKFVLCFAFFLAQVLATFVAYLLAQFLNSFLATFLPISLLLLPTLLHGYLLLLSHIFLNSSLIPCLHFSCLVPCYFFIHSSLFPCYSSCILLTFPFFLRAFSPIPCLFSCITSLKFPCYLSCIPSCIVP